MSNRSGECATSLSPFKEQFYPMIALTSHTFHYTIFFDLPSSNTWPGES